MESRVQVDLKGKHVRTVNVIPGKREHRSLSVPWRMGTVFDRVLPARLMS